MGDLVTIAGIAAGVGSIITAAVGVLGYYINQGRTEGTLKTDIKNLAAAVSEIKDELEASHGQAMKRADEAHDRIDAASTDHHTLREMIAKEYITYERMRELKSELASAIGKMEASQSAALTIMHGRLDALIGAVKKAPRPYDS